MNNAKCSDFSYIYGGGAGKACALGGGDSGGNCQGGCLPHAARVYMGRGISVRTTKKRAGGVLKRRNKNKGDTGI